MKKVFQNILQLIPSRYKTQKMCKKPVGYYPHGLEYAPGCYITQEISKRAVHTYYSSSMQISKFL